MTAKDAQKVLEVLSTAGISLLNEPRPSDRSGRKGIREKKSSSAAAKQASKSKK